MQVFLSFEEVEEEFKELVNEGVHKILLTEANNGGRHFQDVIFDYLNNKDWKDRLKVLIGLSGGSVERLQRVCDVILPEGKRLNDINKDCSVRKIVSKFLADPSSYSDAIPWFIWNCFYLHPGWVSMLRDKNQLKAVMLSTLQSKYSVRMGFALESKVIEVVEALELDYEKGPVHIVDNKEVDVAIPSTKDPRILIMSSYALTTSSSQSSRANEQSQMYEFIQTHNRRHQSDVLMVNVIDGGGWVARRKDLEKMCRYCDAFFSYEDIVRGSLRKYLQEKSPS